MGNAKRKGLFALWAATVSVALAAVLCMCFPMAEVHAAETYTVSLAEDFVYQMANAKDGDTVQLGDDITIDLTDETFVQSVYGSGAEPNKDLYLRAENEPYAITLDLNGKKLEIITGSEKSCFTLGSGITLTVTDTAGNGTVVGHSNGHLFVGEAADSSLVLEKVKVEFTGYSKDGISIQPTGSVISTVGGVTLNDVTYTPEADGPALIDDTAGAQISYVAKTAEELVAAVADSRYATVVLGADITQSITVKAGRTLTLDLNGYTLTTNTSGEGSAAVNNDGTLTIVNTDTANTGVIERADGSTWYTVCNEGTLTIGAEGEGYGALEVRNNNAQDSSSLVENNKDCSPDDPATLTIINGTYTSIGSNLNAVKNDDYGICTIRGGSFTNEATGGSAVMSAGAMTIIAGTFEQKNSNYKSNALTNKGAATSFVVEGGNFIGTINDTADCLEISGGIYSHVFSADCLEEKAALYKNTAGKLVVATEQPADAEKIVAGTESNTSDIDKLFTSLQAAADSLTGASNGFIYMYDSVDGALTIPENTNITLYMGYTLTAADTAVTVNGSLTFDIKGGVIDGNVAVNAGGAVTVHDSANIVFNGSLTVADGASAAIKNGVFNGWIINNGDIELSGGTYKNEPESAWLADGYGILTDEDGTFRVEQLIAQMNYTRDGQPVTEVFANWDDMLARLTNELSAANGEIEIILLDDVPSGSAALEIREGLTVVFEKGKGKNVLADIINHGTLTIRGDSTSGSISGKIENKEGGELVIESGYFKGALQNDRTDGAGISVQSGLFNGADLIRSVSGYLAEGCCFTSMGASAKVGAAQAVAEVTDGGFALRFSTFALANTYGGYALEKTLTITLLQDTSVGKLSVGSFASRAGATDWIIDLDGKTLTLTGDAGLSFGQKNYVSTFTLRDGTVRSGNEGQTYLLTVDNGSKLIFESGTYYGGITRTNGTIDIREGCTFDADIRAFLTGGLTQNTAGTVVNPANAVVMIETADGIDYYYTLQEALAAATDGDTVRLLSDVEPDEMLSIGQAVTLDLNGHTIDSKYNGAYAINIESNGVKITDSTVSGSRADGQAGGTIIASTLALRISGYNDVTIEKIAIESATTAIQIGAGQGSSVTVDGVTIEAGNGILVVGSYGRDGAAAQQADPSTYNRLVLTNSRITGAGYGVLGNGLSHGTVITIADSAITCTGVESSLVPGKKTATAVFHPQVGNLTISGNTTISGPTGIEMRAGTLTIEDNSVTVESTIGYADGFFTVPNGDGTTLGGVAVGISQHTTNLPIKVAISGGTFSAKTGCYAFYETDLQDGVAQDVAASVTGGSFTGKVFSGNLNGFISVGESGAGQGGTFSEVPDALYLCAETAMAVNGDGTYTVVDTTNAAAMETYVVSVSAGDGTVPMLYADLGKALTEAKNGDIVRLVGAAELNERIQLKSDTAKALTLDLNGQTLTLGAGLGETSALWVGANVTLTITATGGGTIDGTGMDDVSVPVSAMETGAAVIIKGGTIVVDTDKESCVYVKNGTLTIEGGTFINECKTPYAHVKDGSSPALTVNVYDGNTDGQYLFVNGGTFVGRNPLLGDTNPKVTGSYLGEGVRVGLNDKGQYVAFTGEDVPEGIAVVYSAETAEDTRQNVATVYTAAALAAALAGDGQFADNTYSVVRLGDNIEGEFTIARSLTLDLNGFTLSSSSEKPVLDIIGGEEPTGTITVSVTSSKQGGERGDGGAIEAGVYVGLRAKQYADVTLTGITVTGAHSGIFISEKYNLSAGIDVPWLTVLTMSDCVVTGGEWGGVYVRGTTNDEPTVFTAEDCSITGGWYAVVGNGEQHNTAITLTDCDLTGTKGDPASTNYDGMGLGIYHPQEGTLVIDGGTVTGVAAGVEMRAGTLIVCGGAEITATSMTANVTPNDNGSTTAGAAIAVSQHTTNKPISVTLGEGTYTGVYALLERDVEDEATVDVTLAVESGTYKGEVASETCEGFVSGGSFTVPVESKYLSEGASLSADGEGGYTVGTAATVATVTFGGRTYDYASLADAFNAVPATGEAVITLFGNIENDVLPVQMDDEFMASLPDDPYAQRLSGGAYYYLIGAEQTITLDLNGHSIVYAGDQEKNANMVPFFLNFGKFTVTDSLGEGSVTNTEINTGDLSAIFCNVGSTAELNVQAGTYDSFLNLLQLGGKTQVSGATFRFGTESRAAEAIDVLSFGGSLTVADGSFQSVVLALSGADITINGGSFAGNAGAQYFGLTQLPGDYSVVVAVSEDFPEPGSLTITDGEFLQALSAEGAEVSLTGGKYKVMPAQSYFVTGYHAEYNKSTGFYETKPGSFVAAVGETAYATLADAVRAAASGSTITLISLEDTVEVNETLKPRQPSLTFDLNGKTIAGGDIDRLFLLGNSNMTFKNGTIRAKNLAFEIEGGTFSGRTVTFADDLTIISENDAAVFLYNSITLDTSADIQAHYAAIMGNGNDSKYPTINIKGGDITSDTTALYLPQPNGVTTISGGTITGATGVEIRGGTLNITGGTITATGDELATEENGSGSTVTKGAAIAVSPYASAKKLTVNAEAGTFSGVYAFYEANLNPDGASVDAVAMTVSLTGGTYDGNVGSERLTGFISGGQYLAMPAEEYFDANYTAQYTNGYFTVVPSSALPAARLNAQTDVRAYAAQFGIVWADLDADNSEETGEKAAALRSAYNAIGEAMTQGDVAEAKLAAFDAVDAYVAAFNAYKDDQLEALAGELGTEGEDGYVVLPTAAWAALREAGSRELFDFYLDKAKQEVNDIRAFRGDIKEQIGDLTDLQSALTDLSAALFGDADGTGAFSDLEKTLSNAITAAQTAIVGKGSSETLADLKTYLSGTILSAINGIDSELGTLASDIGDISTAMSGLMDEETLQQKLSDLSAAITTAQNALGSRLTEELGAAVESVGDAIESVVSSIDTALKDDFEALASAIGTMRTQLGSLTGALATEADELGDAIAAAQSDIDTIVAAVGALGTAGADDLATAITDITAGLGAVQTTVDSIAASVSASTAVESAKAEALTDIETWLTGYVDEILAAAPKASAGVMTAMAYTAETTDGDVYAKLREAFDEENAALVLRYYNEALASIDAALTVSDVTTAVSTFKAQVASVEAAAQNATTVSLTAVYVLLAVLLAAILVAIVLLLLKKQRPAPAPASDDAQPAPVQPAPAAPVSDTAAAAAASTDTANIAFVPDDTAATDDNDDKERVVIEASVRTFAEAYDDLDEEARKLFNDVVDYALGKEGTKEVPRSSGVCIKLGSKQVVKMTVRRGNPVALFVLENEMLKDFRRATNAQAKLKVRATELIIREEADLATAYTMVDLSVEQIKKDAEALKERRRAARRARRKARRAAETEDGGKEE